MFLRRYVVQGPQSHRESNIIRSLCLRDIVAIITDALDLTGANLENHAFRDMLGPLEFRGGK